MSRITRKRVCRVSEQVRHKQGCTPKEDDQRLEILDLGSRGILYYLFGKNKGADQLRDYSAADLCLCFHICKSMFSHDADHIFPCPC